MRIYKIQQQEMTLQEAMSKFINYKKAQRVAAMTMRDYEHYLSEFLEYSHNSTGQINKIMLILTANKYYSVYNTTGPYSPPETESFA